MLKCKDVAALASEYLEAEEKLKWQMRLHLMMCANCRRFIKHLQLTKELVPKILAVNAEPVDAEAALSRVKSRR